MASYIKDIVLHRWQTPLRTSFKHAAAERSSTEAVIAVARSANAISGYGEGCPRSYVTGESLDSCEQFLTQHSDSICEIDSLAALKKWVDEHAPVIDRSPAAWCAIETAILDLLGRTEQRSIESLLDLPALAGSFQYTAVLGADQLPQYLKLGFRDFKLKICGDEAIDRQAIAALRAALPSAPLRLDANNLWRSADSAIEYLSTLVPEFWAVEEPLKAGEYAALEEVAKALDCKIILDESFCRLDQFRHVESNPARWIVNIRVSKMGGLLRSLAIAERCVSLDMKFIVGAQVGETSILTRLALPVANSYRSHLLAQEGAFGTYLLTRDITQPPLMFGLGGSLLAPPPAPGLGFTCEL